MGRPVTDRGTWVSIAVLALSAAYFVLGVLWSNARDKAGIPANDIYGYVYPVSVYAWQAIRDGAGLLWNPYQACGQPFFAISQTGLLYPVNLALFVLDREPALLVTVFLNLCIGGVGTILLCRTLGLGTPAALCGALTFQLSASTIHMAAWTPIHLGAYAWMPVAMWCTERLVRAATVRHAVCLGVALTLQFMPGFPQIVFFTYQLIGLRVGWGVLTRETQQPVALLGTAAGALILPLLLGAIQLLPAMEVARESVRSSPLPASDIGGPFSWHYLGETLRAWATDPGNFLLGSVALLVPLAWHAPVSRHAAFYATVAIVYLVLSLGPGTPLYSVYERLPLGTTFRGSARLLWVTSFAMAVLTGFGVAAAARLAREGSGQLRQAGAAVLLLSAVVFQLVRTGGLRWPDALLGLSLIVILAAPTPQRHARLAGAAALLVCVIMATNWIAFGPKPVYSLRHGDLYGRAAPAYDFVRERLTLQERVLTIGRYGVSPDFSLAQKSASLFRVRSIFDYEPQGTRAYAEFFTFMRMGRPMENLNEWYWVFHKLMPKTLQRRLFDMTAARYILVDRALDRPPRVVTSAMRLLTEVGYVRIYENPQALPRARYVPRIAVVPPAEVLPRLVAADTDPLRVAFVSDPPRSGFLGTDEGGSGTAEIVADRGERVVVRVHASAPGFLYLADQAFPGWTARVNGADAEILRANYAFRLVAVPAGDSEVIFVYRPASVRIGALISLATVCGVALLWWRAGLKRRSPL